MATVDTTSNSDERRPSVPHWGMAPREVRIATVMYGGISLAIYINGIARELLHLVRATASGEDDRPLVPVDALRGVERVYRELGQRVGVAGQEHTRWSADLAAGERATAATEPAILTRVVVDVLSGASAGGINAVFLAKALANDQGLGDLAGLWLTEGEIGTLINDSAAGLPGVPAEDPPKALLSGRRMYAKLLEAFDKMDEARPLEPSRSSPCVRDRLDLFITTTDLHGLPVPLRLSDAIVWERRHRNVFHLSCVPKTTGSPCGHFAAANNAFLAYVARSTSAIPFAFEPMRLEAIDPLLRAARKSWHGGVSGADAGRWKEFFPDYVHDQGRYVARPFADGGILDNKPFGHAIDHLVKRRSSVPVERKLIYIEPSPEAIDPEADLPRPPNAVENGLMAFTLARYETIREDLERVLERNRALDRVTTLTLGLEEDVERNLPSDSRVMMRLDRDEFGAMYLDRLMEHVGLGAAYGSYHRLKVAGVTNDVARSVTVALELDDESDYVAAVRYLVRAWRDSRYRRYENQFDPLLDTPVARSSEAAFLLDFDLAFRVRRLAFVVQQIDAWSGAVGGGEFDEVKRRKLARIAADLIGIDVERTIALLDAEREAATRALRDLRRQVSEALALASDRLRLLREGTRAAEAGQAAPEGYLSFRTVVEKVTDLGRIDASAGEPFPAVLRRILSPVTDPERRQEARTALRTLGPAIQSVADVLASELIAPATSTARASLSVTDDDPALPPVQRLLRGIMREYYDGFERYDVVIFPVLQTAGIGEEQSRIEIFRISPEDATAVVNEKRTRRKKLAGVAYGHFGAFFDRGWRENDILWGRLDAAERLITVLVRDMGLRGELIKRAHVEIVAEELGLEAAESEEGAAALRVGLARLALGEGPFARIYEDLARLRTGVSVDRSARRSYDRGMEHLRRAAEAVAELREREASS